MEGDFGDFGGFGIGDPGVAPGGGGYGGSGGTGGGGHIGFDWGGAQAGGLIGGMLAGFAGLVVGTAVGGIAFGSDFSGMDFGSTTSTGNQGSGNFGGPSDPVYPSRANYKDPYGTDRPADYWRNGQPMWLKPKFRKPEPVAELESELEPIRYIDPQADLQQIDAMNKLAAERNLRFAPARGEESLTKSLDLISERDQLVGARGPDMFRREPRTATDRRGGRPIEYEQAL